MSTPTRQEIIDAHEALEELCKHLYGTRYAKLAILKVLPPLPQKTMAEIKWDDDEHYLAEAENPEYGKVVMLSGSYLSEIIKVLVRRGSVSGVRAVDAANLTPTGKRYTLTEVQE